MREENFDAQIAPLTISELKALYEECDAEYNRLEAEYAHREADCRAISRKVATEKDPKKKRELMQAERALEEECSVLQQKLKSIPSKLSAIIMASNDSIYDCFFEPYLLDVRCVSTRPDVQAWLMPVLLEATVDGRNLSRVVQKVVPEELQTEVRTSICDFLLSELLPSRYVPGAKEYTPAALKVGFYRLNEMSCITETTLSEFAEQYPREAYRFRLVMAAALMERELINLAKECRGGKEPLTQQSPIYDGSI